MTNFEKKALVNRLFAPTQNSRLRRMCMFIFSWQTKNNDVLSRDEKRQDSQKVCWHFGKSILHTLIGSLHNAHMSNLRLNLSQFRQSLPNHSFFLGIDAHLIILREGCCSSFCLLNLAALRVSMPLSLLHEKFSSDHALKVSVMMQVLNNRIIIRKRFYEILQKVWWLTHLFHFWEKILK